MTRKIFVSYKYADFLVQPLNGKVISKAREYVDEIQALLDEDDHIYKGEDDGASLANFKDETIESELKDKIYDSTITIVLISQGMKELGAESDQWIPWEVSYSLKEISRNGVTSQTNGVLAVVLPDYDGTYSYYIEDDACPYCKCRILKTDILFKILRDNMFNAKSLVEADCSHHANSNKVYTGEPSYILSVKWADFKLAPSKYLEQAYTLKEKREEYKIKKEV